MRTDGGGHQDRSVRVRRVAPAQGAPASRPLRQREDARAGRVHAHPPGQRPARAEGHRQLRTTGVRGPARG